MSNTAAPKLEVDGYARIGNGANLWKVVSIATDAAGEIHVVHLTAVRRPNHGTNGGSNRGSERSVIGPREVAKLVPVPASALQN